MSVGAYASRTDVGRIRSNNEDNFLVDHQAELFVVCDGMGGHNAGEVASKICCDTLHEEIGNAIARRRAFLDSGDIARLRTVAQAVKEAVETACKAIYSQARAHSEQSGMGTTCTMVLMAGRHKAVMAHVGDSRLYMLHGGEIVQLSEDHTYVGELVKRGALTPEQAFDHPQGNVLSRAMGVQEHVAVDHLTFDIDPGDTLMLCSDGVYNYYPDPKELAALLADTDLQRAAGQLVNRALERDGHDNLTVVLWRPGTEAAHPVHMPARQRAAMVAQAPPFASLDAAERMAVLGLTQSLQVGQGELIRRQGLRDGAYILVLDGMVDVFAPGASAARLGPGGVAGLPCLVGHPLPELTLRSASPSHVLTLEREDLIALIEAQPRLGAKVLAGLAAGLRAAAPAAAVPAAVGGPEGF